MDFTLWKWTVNAEANDAIDMGSNHRSVVAVFKIPVNKSTKHTRRSMKSKTKGWAPRDGEVYEETLTAKLDEIGYDENRRIMNALQHRCRCIELAIKESAELCGAEEDATTADRGVMRVKALIHERRQLRERGHKDDKSKLSQVSMDLQKELWKARRETGRTVIGRLLDELKDLKRVANVRSGGKTHHLTTMRRSNGDVVDEKQEMVDIFGDFYAELYATRRDSYSDRGWANMVCERVRDVDADEIEELLWKMAKRKAGDQAGLVVEMLQRGGRRQHESLAELFNDLLDPASEPPEYWKETRLKVLFKRGDHAEPGNYRSIAILPILYKLFTKIVCNRIRVHIEANSRVDQAGFRRGFSTEDHIFTIINLMEKMSEFQLPLWIAAIDFQKAFDTVEHDSLWKALFKMEVPPTYIWVLAAMYAGQRGVVVDERDSKMFDIKRGTKQGDPLSPSIFNAVLEQTFSEALPLWQKRKRGIEVDCISKSRLCNLRFADDLLLIASTKRQLTRMLKELMEAVSRVGLAMHPGKTKILTNVGNEHWPGSEFVMVNDDKIDILQREASTMYLGWALCFEATQDAELENRIN